MIELTIPGNPQGKGRARSFLRRNGSIGHHTPEKTRTYEGLIRTQAMDAMGNRAPSLSPIALSLHAFYPIPEGWPRWKREAALAGKIAPTVKPDIDNVEKAVKDALNGVAWKDDSQVVIVTTFKYYSETPRVAVFVEEVVGTHPAQIKTQSEFNAA